MRSQVSCPRTCSSLAASGRSTSLTPHPRSRVRLRGWAGLGREAWRDRGQRLKGWRGVGQGPSWLSVPKYATAAPPQCGRWGWAGFVFISLSPNISESLWVYLCCGPKPSGCGVGYRQCQPHTCWVCPRGPYIFLVYLACNGQVSGVGQEELTLMGSRPTGTSDFTSTGETGKKERDDKD